MLFVVPCAVRFEQLYTIYYQGNVFLVGFLFKEVLKIALAHFNEALVHFLEQSRVFIALRVEVEVAETGTTLFFHLLVLAVDSDLPQTV